MENKKEYTLTEKLTYAIPYKWKIQSKSKDGKKAQCVAYIDARDVMDLLDRAVGIENWRDSYRREGSLICKLELRIGGEWVAKEDTGVPSPFEGEKGEFSDAFKRAAVKWGIGRFLYDLDFKWVDLDTYGNPVDKAGARIWDLTDYFNKL